MRRTRLEICGLLVAAAAMPACSDDKPGIEVSVDLAGLSVRSLKVAISTNMGGFKPFAPTNVQNIPLSTEDFDGDGTIDLVSVFSNPTGTISFRVQTDNQVELQVAGRAVAFDDKQMIAGADSSMAPLPAGGRASIALKLEPRGGGIVGPDTRSTDVKTASPDITVTPGMEAAFASVAVCKVDGDTKPDIVIGAPQAKYLDQAVGAVYVVQGKNGFGSTIDLATPGSAMVLAFYGQFPADQLGAAVACADVNNDGADDLIIGAPGAHLGGGEVYVIFGGLSLPSRTGMVAATGANVVWQSTSDSGFGGKLLARDLVGDEKAEVLAGPQTSGKVHLFTNVPSNATAPINVDAADHVTFAKYHVSSMAAGNLTRAGIGGLDIVIGDTEARMPGTSDKRGAIYAFPAVDPDAKTQYDATAPDPMITTIYGNLESQFGAATLAINTTGEGDDLIIGAPGDNTGAGAFYVFKGDSDFFYLRTRPLTEFAAHMNGPAAMGRFGAALAATPSGTGATISWSLLVGAPGTARSNDRPLAGAAYLFSGGLNWPFPLYEELFGAATGDGLGTFVAGGQVDGDAIGDLVTVAPGGGADHNGVVYVQYNHVLPGQ